MAQGGGEVTLWWRAKLVTKDGAYRWIRVPEGTMIWNVPLVPRLVVATLEDMHKAPEIEIRRYEFYERIGPMAVEFREQ